MNKSALKAIRSLGLALIFSLVSHAQVWDTDLSYLSPETLPPPRLVVEAGLNALPRSLGELRDFDRRMRLAALAPNLNVRYRMFEGPSRRFDVVEQSTTRSIRNTSNAEANQTRISTDPLDSFTQDNVNMNVGSQSFRETRYPVPLALSDEEVWREEIAIQAVWRLSDLIYHPDELRATGPNRTIAAYRLQYMERIISLYRAFVNTVNQWSINPDSRSLADSVEDRLIILDNLTDNFITDYAMARQAELPRSSPRAERPVTRKSAPPVDETIEPARPTLDPYQPVPMRSAEPVDPLPWEDEPARDQPFAIEDDSIPGEDLDPRRRTPTGEAADWENDSFYDDDLDQHDTDDEFDDTTEEFFEVDEPLFLDLDEE